MMLKKDVDKIVTKLLRDKNQIYKRKDLQVMFKDKYSKDQIVRIYYRYNYLKLH